MNPNASVAPPRRQGIAATENGLLCHAVSWRSNTEPEEENAEVTRGQSEDQEDIEDIAPG